MRKGLMALLASLTAGPLFFAETNAAFLDNAVAHAQQNRETIEKMENEFLAQDDFWPASDSWLARYRPYVVKDGVLQIPVDGVLLSKCSYCIPGWFTGYEYLQRALDRGLDDGNVRGIAFIVDSPGGHVAENFEFVDHLFAARGQKPIRGYASDSAYSAAYSIISACDTITVSRSGGTGSVGVLTAHVDVSAMHERIGIKVTLVFAGDRKVDGNPYEALSKEARERMQARVEKLYGEFVGIVARNRGMGEDAVRATQALTYDAEDSIEVGFADTIGNANAAIIGFATELEAGDEQMATDADVTNARTEGHTAGRTEGMTAGAQAERARMSAILNGEAGKKRPKAALAALNTSMSAEEANTFLASLPEEPAPTAATAAAPAAPEGQPQQPAAQQPQQQAPAAAASHFNAHMNGSTQPNVGDGNGDANANVDPVDTLLKDFSATVGRDFTRTAPVPGQGK